MTNFRLSKLKEFADDNFKFEENGKVIKTGRKHCGKRRNCSSRPLSPFPTVFSTHFDNFLPSSSNLKLSSANSFSLEESKIRRLVMG